MSADDEKVIAFLPVTKIIPVDLKCLNQPQEEEKKVASDASNSKRKTPSANKKTLKQSMSAVGEDDGTPNSFHKKDLALKLSDLKDD